MAEPQKGTTAVDPKVKKSLLDDEIGKDFLSSWKSMSVAEDDAMDFSFDNVGKGTQKKFNFEKLDMDFNLDGDFDKLSSFKLDMPDLDFSSPAKKTAKGKEGNAEESSGRNCQGKQAAFSFSFDFNELDNFDFDSSLPKSEKAKKDPKSDGVASVKFDDPGPKIHQSECVAAFDSDNKRFQGSKSTNVPYVDNSANCSGDIASKKTGTVPEPTVSGMEVPQNEETTLQTTADTPPKETNKQNYLSENDISGRPYAENRDDRSSNSESEFRKELYSQLDPVNCSSRVEQDVIDKKAEDTSVHENLQSLDPPAVDISMSENESKDLSLSAIGDSSTSMDRIKHAQGEFDAGDEPSPNISRNMQCDNKVNSKDENSGEKLAMASLRGELGTNGVRAVNGKQSGRVCSKFFKKFVDSGNQSEQVPLMLKKATQIGRKQIGTVNPNRTEGTSLHLNRSSSTDKLKENINQTSAKPEPLNSSAEALRNSKIAGLGGSKLDPIKIVETTCNLSGLSMSRVSASNEEHLVSRSLSRNSSLSSSAKKAELGTISVEKVLSPLNNRDRQVVSINENRIEKQVLPTPSLKRKIYEISDNNLMSCSPLKRFSDSPGEGRRSKESSQKEIREPVCNNLNQLNIKTKDVSNDISTSQTEISISNDVKVVQLEFSKVTENDGSVEKAEQYAKDLENICSMLKKKREEAKELLVRALVNNNNLLMLNHPMFEEKIRKIERLASRLMAKDVKI